MRKKIWKQIGSGILALGLIVGMLPGMSLVAKAGANTFSENEAQNGASSNADIVNVNQDYTGKSSSDEDKDFFKFSLNADGYISVSFKSENEDTLKGWRVYLLKGDYNGSGSLLSNYTIKDFGMIYGVPNNKTEFNSINIGLPSGSYFLYVVGGSNSSSNYTNLDYTFNIKFTADEHWETEWNNHSSEADPINTDTEYTASSIIAGDKDFFRFDLANNSEVSLTFSSDENDTLKRWHIYLLRGSYNGSGSLVSSYVLKNWDYVYGASGGVSETLDSIYLGPGRYFLYIEGGDDSDNRYSSSDYKIKVNVAGSAYSVAVSGGSIVSGTTNGLAKQGDTVMVRATSPEGQTFKEWTSTGIDLTSDQKTAAELSFEMPASNVTLTATFNEAAGPNVRYAGGTNDDSNSVNFVVRQGDSTSTIGVGGIKSLTVGSNPVYIRAVTNNNAGIKTIPSDGVTVTYTVPGLSGSQTVKVKDSETLLPLPAMTGRTTANHVINNDKIVITGVAGLVSEATVTIASGSVNYIGAYTTETGATSVTATEAGKAPDFWIQTKDGVTTDSERRTSELSYTIKYSGNKADKTGTVSGFSVGKAVRINSSVISASDMTDATEIIFAVSNVVSTKTVSLPSTTSSPVEFLEGNKEVANNALTIFGDDTKDTYGWIIKSFVAKPKGGYDYTDKTNKTVTFVDGNGKDIPATRQDAVSAGVRYYIEQDSTDKTKFTLHIEQGADLKISDVKGFTHTGTGVTVVGGKSYEKITYSKESDLNSDDLKISGSSTEAYRPKSAFKKGDTVYIIANKPEKSGENFQGWTLDSGDVTIDNILAETTSFKMGEKDVKITANFGEGYMVHVVDGWSRGVSSSNSNSTVRQATFKENEKVYLEWDSSKKPANRNFVRWTTTDSSLSIANATNSGINEASFTMPARNVLIRPEYGTGTYTLTLVNAKLTATRTPAASGSSASTTASTSTSSSSSSSSASSSSTSSSASSASSTTAVAATGATTTNAVNFSQKTEQIEAGKEVTITVDGGNNTFTGWVWSPANAVTSLVSGNVYSNSITFIMPAQNLTMTANLSGQSNQNTSTTAPFSDVTVATEPSNDDSLQAIVWAKEHGIIQGVGNNQFNPNGYVTRYQLALILYRMAGSPTVASGASFTDINNIMPGNATGNAEAQRAIAWLQTKGWVQGTTTTTFSPNNSITRGHTVLILHRIAGTPNPSTNTMKFPDVLSTHEAYRAILWASSTGSAPYYITRGYSTSSFGPNDYITRRQLSQMLYRANNAGALTNVR